MGGDSLIGVQVISRIKRAFSVQLASTALYEGPTLDAFARAIDAARARAGAGGGGEGGGRMSQPYERFIRFADIDAAGFVFFANYLVLCHEAYEASLRGGRASSSGRCLSANAGAAPDRQDPGAVPGAPPERQPGAGRPDPRAPVGAHLPRRLPDHPPARTPDKLVGLAQTEHLAIDLTTLERKPLPAGLVQWLSGPA